MLCVDRNRLTALAGILVFSFTASLSEAQTATAKVDGKYPTLGTITRKDSRFDALIPKDARVERIAEGFDWSEGPVWDKKGGQLLFSDVPKNKVYSWSEGEGVKVFLEPSGYTGTKPRGGEPGSNGLTFSLEGTLTLMQHGDRRVGQWTRLDANTTNFGPLVASFEGKRFNSPNDGTFDSKGNFYFTDPPYGLLKGNADPEKDLPFNGVYRVSKHHETTLLTKEMTFPNGIALSPDEKTLYVANSDPKKAIWMAYPLKEDGTVGTGRVFADVTKDVGKSPGLPDGMKVDNAGNLFASGPGGILIFASDGTHLGTLKTGQATANCNWGEDGSVLYITADMYIGRIKTTTKGKLP